MSKVLTNDESEFEYIMNNFEEIIGEPLLVYSECLDSIEKYLNRKLTNYEKEILSSYVSKCQELIFHIRMEMSEMDDNMYNAWYDWRAEANYYAYDSYPVKDQVKIWRDFCEYYESNMNEYSSEDDYDIFEEDYDY